MRFLACLLALFLISSIDAANPVKVFILAGQSNMEGKARVSLMEHQATDDKSGTTFAHMRNGDQWIEREDVSIKFLDRHGNLTVGYGSPGCIGPELEFGWRMGDHYDQHVLLIKTAWGGKSLYRDFRSPSSGLPNEAALQKLLERAKKRTPEATLADVQQSFGHYYRLMLQEVNSTLNNIAQFVPDYESQGYELGGVVWFQGWNDMVDQVATAEYAQNMGNFIRDIRKDLQHPKLPFVIGQLGVGGLTEGRPNPKKDTFKKAQVAPAEKPEFANNVFVVRTDQYWDMEADAVFKKGWKENLQEWNTVGSDRPYHYLGSAKCFSRIGKAFAIALLEKKSDEITVAVPVATQPKLVPGSSPESKIVFYDPIEKNIEGWTVKVDPQLLTEDNKQLADDVFKALANHLQRVKYIVPADRLAKLTQLRIWLELENDKLGAMQYHPSRGWLLANGHDPRLEKHVHIPHARDLQDRHTWIKHPYVVLHELAHAYHDQILSFDNEEVVSAFDKMKEAGSYEEVLLYTGRKVRHYGLSNHKEYFAESTEAYLGVNDFYPFVRAELKEHDPTMYGLMEKFWGPVK